ncbi:hypothetical protein F5Y15DRAFT_413158 [Xylariaceae sp. FL0016]|nr:hypothetical protein F5Y15DRAFT_413158 [Xylariaceae sp. FL0016]
MVRRMVIPALIRRGLDLNAIDWIGFCMSDEPLVTENINFELHVRTLTACHTSRQPRLSPLLLLGSFYPPRPTDIKINWLLNSFTSTVIDGLCPPTTVSSLHEEAREFWASGQAQMKVALLFGHDYLLLGDYRDILLRAVKTAQGNAEGMWLYEAGYYPVDEKPLEIAERFADLVEKGSMLATERLFDIFKPYSS